MVKGVKGKNVKGGFPTIVDYSTSIEDLLKRGSYNRVSSEITSINFPSKKKGKDRIVAKVLNIRCRPVFGSPGFVNELIGLQEKGYIPVDLRELLTVLNQHKNIKALPVIWALGSTIDIGDDLLSPKVIETYYVELEET
jgi:hypothetical protein